MGKLSKRELKEQKDIFNNLLKKDILTPDEIEYIYDNLNPLMIDNCSERGVFFTPTDLCRDVATFFPKHGHIVDICGGIGKLSYWLRNYDYYERTIKSLTIIELNPQFVEIGKKLLPQANWINGNVFDKSIWDDITKDLEGNKFDYAVSNPPFGRLTVDPIIDTSWINYQGDLDVMVLELVLRYSKNGGYMIIPPASCDFRFSGRPYHEYITNKKLEKFRKFNPDLFFRMEADGIDCSLYVDEWDNTKVMVEVARINVDKEDYE